MQQGNRGWHWVRGQVPLTCTDLSPHPSFHVLTAMSNWSINCVQNWPPCVCHSPLQVPQRLRLEEEAPLLAELPLTGRPCACVLTICGPQLPDGPTAPHCTAIDGCPYPGAALT